MAPTRALQERPFQTPPPLRRRRRIRRLCVRLRALKRTARRIAPILVFPIAFPCGIERHRLLGDRGDWGHGRVQAFEEADDVLRYLGSHGRGGRLAGGLPERAGVCVVEEVRG